MFQVAIFMAAFLQRASVPRKRCCHPGIRASGYPGSSADGAVWISGSRIFACGKFRDDKC
jgi:hypothetical protein